jgi:hypothetical protein
MGQGFLCGHRHGALGDLQPPPAAGTGGKAARAQGEKQRVKAQPHPRHSSPQLSGLPPEAPPHPPSGAAQSESGGEATASALTKRKDWGRKERSVGEEKKRIDGSRVCGFQKM